MPVNLPVLGYRGRVTIITHDCLFPGHARIELLYFTQLIKDLEIKDINRGAINLVDLTNIISFVYITWILKNNSIRIISDRANNNILESENKILLNEYIERISPWGEIIALIGPNSGPYHFVTKYQFF